MSTLEPQAGPFELVLAESQLPRPSETPAARGDSPGIALAAARFPGGPTLPEPGAPGLTALISQLAGDLFAAPTGLSPVSGSAPSALSASSAPSSGGGAPSTPAVPGESPGGAPNAVPAAQGPAAQGPAMGSVAPFDAGGAVPGAPAPRPFDAPLDFGALGAFDQTPIASFALLSESTGPAPAAGGGSAPGGSAPGGWPGSTSAEPSTTQPAADWSGPYWLRSADKPQGSAVAVDAFQLDPLTGTGLSDGKGSFDPHALRREFPILNERVNGKRLVWLDNAATTQKPQAVIDRVSFFYEHENSNIHRAAHTLAARATDAYESARETARRFIGAPSKDGIVFVRGATEGINLVAKAWGSRHVREGDEILLTHLEHHANIVPWQQLARETGAKLLVAPVDDRGSILLEEYERLLSDRTRIVAFTQVSNALGTVTPAAEMIALAHRRGARVLLDGAQAVSHTPVDVQALDCDFYVFSGHKVFAPTGIGVVYGKKDVLDAMPPWQGGGNMIQDVTFERTVYQGPPARFEAGTGNIADAAGLGAALDWLSRIGVHNVERYEHELLDYATARLLTVPGLRLVGTSPNKAGVLSFVLAGQKTEEVGGLLDQEGIAVRSGHHCAQPILRRLGLEATVRASLAPYNTTEDIDALVSALHRLQAGQHAA